jgi:hypothetical protein
MSLIYINPYSFAAPWTPALITTAIWLDASDSSTITESGGVVSQWDDKSGNGRHFTQATVANRPTFESAVQNGLSAVKFVNGPGAGATRQFIGNTSYTNAANQITLFSVHRNLSGASGANIFGRLFSFASSTQQDYNNTAGITLLYGVTTGIALYRNNATIASTAAINDTWCVVDAERDAGNGSVSLNGNTRVTGSTSTANFNIQRSRIGNDFAAADSGMQGWIGENIAISGVIDASTTEKMQGYLAWKWGLTGSLPGGHPYKNAAPTA